MSLNCNRDRFFDWNDGRRLTTYDEYYVGFTNKANINKPAGSKIKRRNLPRISDMLEWGVIKAGDIIVEKNRTEEAVLLDNGQVLFEGEEQSMQKWLKDIFGWSSIQTYVFAVHKEKDKSLSEIREEFMNRNDK